MSRMALMDAWGGIATVSAITFGLAPGCCARTITAGGTTSGYSAIGRKRSAINPEMRMSNDSTPAKIGRSMKNLDRFMVFWHRGDRWSGRQGAAQLPKQLNALSRSHLWLLP